jgi:RHS repeat-associated protein
MTTRLSVALLIWFAFFNVAEAQTVGRTPGHFNVSQVGSAQYSIPIWAPPGPRGMQPNISLLYDSGSSIGPLGIGWSLAGLGVITRCNLTTAQDTTPAPVALVTTDGYCMNGKRLRLTGGTYGTAGSTYQTEIADFSNITANLTAGNGPQYFTVQGRNGLTYYYGYTDTNGNGANSEVLANGSTTALTWLLSKVVDRAGNNYVINYLAPSTSLSGTSVPNKILWTPVSAGSSSYTYTMQFNYSSNVPQSSINQYVAGTLVSNTELLTSIEILLGSTVVKDYFLTYQGSPLTAREELINVQECADSAKSNCLLPTTINYQAGSPGLSTVSNSALTSSGALLSARYDLNGDGYPDLVYLNGTTTYVAFGSASGYGAPVSTGISGLLIGNITGGNQDGILAVKSGVWWYYSWNGSSFVGTSTGLAYDSTAFQYQLADVDGDGRPDLVALYITGPNGLGKYTATVYTRLNTSSGGTPSFSSTLNTANTKGSLVSAQLLTPDMQYAKLRRYDFDGDGRDDVVLQTITGKSPSFTVNTYELISTGTTFNSSLIQSTAASNYPTMFFTDWNDDKCTDIVTFGTLYVSGCNGTAPASYAIGTVVAAIDYDGDGRTDLMVVNGSTLGVYLSKATGAPSLTATSIPYVSTCQYVWMDANGDGLDDLGCWSQTGSNPLTYYLHNGTSDLATGFADGYGNSASPTYLPISEGNYQNNTDAVFPDVNYIGPMYVVSSAAISEASAAPGTTYTLSYYYYWAWMNLQGRGFDGFGAMRTADSRTALEDYKYYERAFPYTGLQYQEIITYSSFYALQATGTTALTTLSSTPNQQRYFPNIGNWTTTRREVGGSESGDLIDTTSTTLSYDNYGNTTSIVKTVTDNDPGAWDSAYTGNTWTTTTTNTPDISTSNESADLAAWCLPLIDNTVVVYSSTINGSSTVTRTKTFTPDPTTANCRITQIVTEPTANSGLYKVTEALTFDSFGNIATDTVTGANMPSSPASRLTTFNWGTTGQFLGSITDPSSATTTASYTSNQSLTFGVPDSVTNPNNLTTSWLYDAFGRKSKESRPDGTSSTWTWSTCTSFCGWSNSFYQIAQTNYQTNGSTVIRTDTNYYDPIDRVTETSGPTVTGSTGLVQNLYNSLGLLTQQSLPRISGATAYQKTYSYDALNRVLSVSRPISSTNSTLQTTSYAYAGRKFTITDPYGNTKTLIKDVKGALRQTKDALGYNITRSFDAAESLTGVTDSVGNTLLSGVTYVYGLQPFRLGATDADRGAWTYTVDSLGELTGWTDAKGQSFSMSYDALSRPVSRTEPDLFTQWTYGSTPASHNIGQLISECTQTVSPCSSTSALYYESRTFDADGRPSTRAITESGNPGNDPGGVFLFTSTYSTTTGLPNTLTYPISTAGVAFILQYYYQYGLLFSVEDATPSDPVSLCGSTCALWTANAMNGFGEITQETLGNGVVTNRTYDPVTSWLSLATAGVGGGAALLNQSYLEDENGNIIQRQNNNAGLTESFAYDADQRLSCAALSSSCTAATLAYDGGVAGPGNITSQTGVGTYTYPAAGQPRPHAVTSLTGTFNGITNPSFVYDANGNMTSRASSTVTWSSYNYPTNINASDVTGAEEVQLSYGPDRQRWKQIYTAPGTTETTYYIGELVDMAFSGGVTNYRHYIYAGGEAVAVYSRTSASVNTMSYMIEDHQGSISNISSNSGASDINESFSAFGARRNGSTWSGAPTTADLNTIAGLSRQGYTMQTWLGQSMGLNHMNGRVEDAILGRFLSPDPYIPDPSNPQSYNRYSYVNNNPMSLIDPSGFDDSGNGNGNGNGSGSSCGGPGGLPTPGLCDPNGGGLGVSWFGGGGIGGGGSNSQQNTSDDQQPDPDGLDTVYVTSCGATCYDPDSWVQSPGVNTAPGLPLVPFTGQTVTVTASRPEPTQNSFANWLCQEGNSFASASDLLGTAGGRLEMIGLGWAGVGLLTGQPEVAAPGVGLAATGGLASMGAGALQFGAGLMQGISGHGFGNSLSAAVTFGSAWSIAKIAPTVSGYRTVSQRASDSFLKNTAIATGGAFDALTSLLQQLGPQEVSCQ